MQKSVPLSILAAGLLAVCTVPGFSADMAPEDMSPEMQAMMQNFMAYQQTTARHEQLATLTGEWDAEITHWMTKDAPAQKSTGHATGEMTMGGRFLEQNYVGEWEGQEFIGRAVLGYDNIREIYTSIWYDNMGTGIAATSGSYDAEAKAIEQEGTLSCPMTNAARWYRSKTTFIDANHYTFETFVKDPDGKEYRSMLIEYTRS